MSQSDYIRHKRLSKILNNVSELKPILNSQDYTDFKEYSLENTIKSAKNVYYKYIPPEAQYVYGMEIRNSAGCSDMSFCINTHLRENRATIDGSTVIYKNPVGGMNYQPKPMRPIALKTVKINHPEKVSIQNNVNCKCAFT